MPATQLRNDSRATLRGDVPAQRRAPRQQAAVAALDAALQESGCILVSTTVAETGCSKLLVTHGEADALVHWAKGQGIEAEPLHILGYGDEEEVAGAEVA